MSPRSHSERSARSAVPIGRRPRPSAGRTAAQRKGYIVTRRASEELAGRKEAEGRPPNPAAAAAAAATCRGLTHHGARASRPPRLAPVWPRPPARFASAPSLPRPPQPLAAPAAEAPALAGKLPNAFRSHFQWPHWLPGLTHLPGNAAAAAGPGRRGRPGGRLGGGGAAPAGGPRCGSGRAAGALVPGEAKFQRQPWRGGGGDSLLLSSPALTTILLVQEMTWKTEESGVWGRRGPPNSGAGAGTHQPRPNPAPEKPPGAPSAPAPHAARWGEPSSSNPKGEGEFYNPAGGEIEKETNK